MIIRAMVCTVTDGSTFARCYVINFLKAQAYTYSFNKWKRD